MLAYSCEFLTAKTFHDKSFLKFLSLLIQKQFKGQVSFFYVNDEELSKLDLARVETEAEEAVLVDLFENKKEELINLGIPTWRDESFQESLNYFLFPYYEGSKLLSFSIVVFEDVGLNHLLANDLEQFLKIGRCCFLEGS